MKQYFLPVIIAIAMLFTQSVLAFDANNFDENGKEKSVVTDTFESEKMYNSDIAYSPLSTPTEDFGNIMLNSIGAGFGMIFVLLVYIAFPIILYCVGSFSLARLDMHYNKVKSSGISWVPFARYFHIIKNATGSGKKAFCITVLPWIIFIIGLVGVVGFMVAGLAGNALYSEQKSWFVPVMMTMAGISVIGFLSMIAMNFWRAFIIKNYVKGDTTTALGLSTYTAVVLWYIALQRSTGKTDIIGKIGFICIGLVALAYVIIIALFVYSGVTEGFNSMNSMDTYGDISGTIGGDL